MIEIYPSVQGETSYTGLPTTFVRLAACNLRCTWCDTPYSFGRGTPMSLESIIEQIETYNLPYVCITGGEPLLQGNIHSLMQSLCDKGYLVSIETGGSLDTSGIDKRVKTILDIKCPGSGMHEKNYWENLQYLKPHDEIKFVILNADDYKWAIDICRKYELFGQEYEILFSPVFGELNTQELVQWIVRDKIPVRLNLQVHKFIWTPETKGV